MKIVTFLVILVCLFSCNYNESGKSTPQSTPACACEETIETDSVLFVKNIRLQEEGEGKVLLFNCAAIDRGVAAISDENGRNEREKFIYDVKCVSVVDQRLELSEDFKYFTEEMQTPSDFFKVIRNHPGLFFEITVKAKKIKSVWKLDVED